MFSSTQALRLVVDRHRVAGWCRISERSEGPGLEGLASQEAQA